MYLGTIVASSTPAIPGLAACDGTGERSQDSFAAIGWVNSHDASVRVLATLRLEGAWYKPTTAITGERLEFSLYHATARGHHIGWRGLQTSLES